MSVVWLHWPICLPAPFSIQLLGLREHRQHHQYAFVTTTIIITITTTTSSRMRTFSRGERYSPLEMASISMAILLTNESLEKVRRKILRLKLAHQWAARGGAHCEGKNRILSSEPKCAVCTGAGAWQGAPLAAIDYGARPGRDFFPDRHRGWRTKREGRHIENK